MGRRGQVPGGVVSTPTLEHVLDFDYELRRHASHLVGHEDFSYVDALGRAQKCEDLRRKHFTGPVLLSWLSRTSAGGGKAKGKAPGKRSLPQGAKSKSSDGQPICFAYNRATSAGNCGTVHARWCCKASDHTGANCPKARA